MELIKFGFKKQKKKKLTRQELQDKVILLQEELDEKKDELLDIYKERGKSFSSQIRYIDVVESQKKEINNLKQKLIEMNLSNKTYRKQVEEYIKSLLKITPNIKKCKDKQTFLLYLDVYYLASENIDINDVIEVCKKLNITKQCIKNYDENIYNKLQVENWEIEL